MLLRALMILGVYLLHWELHTASQTVETISSLDCRYPDKISNGLYKSICQEEEDKEGLTEEVVVLQQSDQQVLPAFKCTKVESRFKEVCGAFSHTKLYNPPQILQQVIITPTVCDQMAQYHSYVTEDHQIITTELNVEYSYSYVAHGKLFYSSNNVNCEGSSVLIHGEEVSSIVEMVATKVMAKQISVEITGNQMLDLDSNTRIPSGCMHDKYCQVGTTAYVIIQPDKNCPLSVVQHMTVEYVTIRENGAKLNAMVSHEHKALFTMGEQEAAPEGCQPVFTMFSTEYPNLKVVSRGLSIADTSNIHKHLPADIMDLELEIKITASYNSFQAERSLMQHLQGMSAKICRMNTHNLGNTELSPFHTNALVRQRGDIISELLCKPVLAHVRMGENRNRKCYSDSLPAWVGNTPVWIQAVTHLVLDEEDAEEINCNSTFLPVFLMKSDRLILAGPEVQYANITLHHLEDSYLHLEDKKIVEHENFGEDFLYTHQEMEAYNTLIHHQRVKARIVGRLVDDYCVSNQQCGSYQPSQEPPAPFDLSQIEDTVSSPFSTFFQWVEKVEKIGSVCSLLVVVMMVGNIFYRISRVFWMVFKNGFDCCRAMRANFWLPTERKPARTPVPTHQVENPAASVPQVSVPPGPPVGVVTQPPPLLMTNPPLAYFART